MTRPMQDLDPATQVVHAGEREDTPVGRPVATPIYASTTFTYDSIEEIDRVFSGEVQGYVYTRHGNPTISAFAEAVKVLEAGESACAYSSGMAAVHAALLACDLAAGTTVLASQDLYGATTSLLETVFGSFDIKVSTVDFADITAVREAALATKPRAIIAETISNPLLKVCDVEACSEIAAASGARLIIDNTFATPYICQPLKHGADLVVHSATKFLNGHGDATGGVVVARERADEASLIRTMKLVGGVAGVWESYEILRGIKTLALRMDRQSENARMLSSYLSNHRRISRVYYPGHGSPDVAEKIDRLFRVRHGGALVSVELGENTREAAFQFMNRLQLCVRSTSLGDVFTSVLHPATSSHREITAERKMELGISEGLVRISVGIEAIDDIVADIEQALE